MKKKPEYLLKSDVHQIIQNYIRSIQMMDYGKDKGISELYCVMDMIDKMKGIILEDK